MRLPIDYFKLTSYLVPFRSYLRLLFKFWTLHFLSHHLAVLGATYTVNLRLIEKLVLDFLFVLIELFPSCYS